MQESFRITKIKRNSHKDSSPPLIKTIDEHLQSSSLGEPRFESSKLIQPSNRIQNVKLYVQTELLADGTIQRVIPFSTRVQSRPIDGMTTPGKRSLANSPSKNSSVFQANQSSASASADYYTMLY